MKKTLLKLIALAIIFLPQSAFAAGNPEVANFTQDALTTLIILASTAVVFFLIRGGYMYMTSSGNPVALEDAKRTMKRLLDDYQDPENIEIWFATNEDLKECGITSEIWEEN